MPRYSAEEKSRIIRFIALSARNYLRSTLKNCVKILIGRPCYYNDRDLFFRQYLFQLVGIRKITCITSPGLRNEGAGSQALMIVHAIKFARANGLTYVHTPFTLVHHADRPQEEWVAAWEKFFNLGLGEAPCSLPRHRVVNYCYNFEDLELLYRWHGRGGELGKYFAAEIPSLRRKYYSNKSPRTNERFTVAVHVRRGDAVPGHWYHTPDSIVRRTILAVQSVLDRMSIDYRLGVYTQGSASDFPELDIPGIQFFMGKDAFTTLSEMIEADLLVTAKGCFSYYAALICDGIILFEEDFPPMDGWIVRSPDGSFDEGKLMEKLTATPPGIQ